MELVELRFAAHLSQEKAAKLCGVSVRTWRRWERGQTRAPRAVWELLNLMRGELSLFGWRRWYFNNGRLYAPELRDGFSPGDVRAIWWNRGRIYDLQRELRILQRKIEPEPIAKTRLCFLSLQLTFTLHWRWISRMKRLK